MEWQPIETYNSTGWFIGAIKKENGDWVMSTMAMNCRGEYYSAGSYRVSPPTHWMPLPEPPK